MNNDRLYENMVTFLKKLQDKITRAVLDAEEHSANFPFDSKLKPAEFKEDKWRAKKKDGLLGGGRTRVLEGGRVFERAGVNFSKVSGTFKKELLAQMPGSSPEFQATGVSLVFHPRNPHVPTVHANFRIIRQGPGKKGEKIWFGGGADLTPYILYRPDCTHFHQIWSRVCENHTEVVDYKSLKEQCDSYFFLPHRGEARGIGGIFYDHLMDKPEQTAAFSKEAGSAFIDSYFPILERRISTPYGEEERDFQLWRRGRYVEFNLLWDRGTQFGIKTGGRTQSILMSMPPLVRWEYDYTPRKGSVQEELLKVLKKPVDWV